MKPVTVFSVLLSLLATVLMSPWIPRSFTGHHDFVGAFNSQMARNYLRYGLLTTKLGQVTNFGTVTSSAFSFHTHHPPGVPLMLAFSYRLFGEHESVGRATFALFALGSTMLIFLLIADTTTIAAGAFATLLSITTPLFVYTSILPVYEAPALFLMLLQIYCFKRWILTGKRTHLVLVVVGAIVGYVTAWVTYMTIPILIADRVLSRSSKGLRVLLILFLFSILFFGLHLAHTKLLTGDWFGGGLRDIFLRRTGLTPEPNQAFSYTTIKYIDMLVFRLKNFYGIPLLTVSVIGLVRAIVDRKKKKSRRLLFLLTGIALALPVLFRNYVFVHDYLLYYTTPLVGMTAAVGIASLVNRARSIGLLEDTRVASVVAAIALVGITAVATRLTWKDLWESIHWDETSPIIGGYLRSTTTSGQSILIVNQPLKEEEMNLQYYADRAVSFPAPGDLGPFDPDVMVNVTSDYQFPPDYKEKILEEYRLEVDQGVEYYYRK